ncbi:phosphate uptake regulator PhoU [Candidatus Woesearchaeota archaeon]|nr:phosphate uptake regulator PhoU [Candidatus Woesearchaeota archaeon]
MIRKVIQLAGNTLVVSLPAKWVKQYGVHKGDEVDVIQKDQGLLVQTARTGESGKITVDVSGRRYALKRILGALYKVGYDEVHARFSSLVELQQIQEVVREAFIGFEVIDQKKDSVTFKKVSHIEPKEFSAMVRRMFLIVISAGEDTLAALNNKDAQWLSAIVMRDKDVNKIADFCRRVLNTTGSQEYRRPAPGYFIVEQVEKLGDQYRDIAAELAKDPIEISAETQKLFNETNAYFKSFYNLHNAFDLEKMDEFYEHGVKLRKELSGYFEKVPRQELRLLFSLQNIVTSTLDMNGALMSVHL